MLLQDLLNVSESTILFHSATGAGKTTQAVEILAKHIRADFNEDKIIYCSSTVKELLEVSLSLYKQCQNLYGKNNAPREFKRAFIRFRTDDKSAMKRIVEELESTGAFNSYDIKFFKELIKNAHSKYTASLVDKLIHSKTVITTHQSFVGSISAILSKEDKQRTIVLHDELPYSIFRFSHLLIDEDGKRVKGEQFDSIISYLMNHSTKSTLLQESVSIASMLKYGLFTVVNLGDSAWFSLYDGHDYKRVVYLSASKADIDIVNHVLNREVIKIYENDYNQELMLLGRSNVTIMPVEDYDLALSEIDVKGRLIVHTGICDADNTEIKTNKVGLNSYSHINTVFVNELNYPNSYINLLKRVLGEESTSLYLLRKSAEALRQSLYRSSLRRRQPVFVYPKSEKVSGLIELMFKL